jgi:hypothetical protein
MASNGKMTRGKKVDSGNPSSDEDLDGGTDDDDDKDAIVPMARLLYNYIIQWWFGE